MILLALIMVGGFGRRMSASGEKPMLALKGRPMISYVLDTLRNSECFDGIIAVVSNNTPRTTEFLDKNGVRVMNSSGIDYVKDLNYALGQMKPRKVFIISSDLPLIDSNTVKEIVSSFDVVKKPCLTVVVSKGIIDRFGINIDYCIEYKGKLVCHSGISIIDSSKILGYDSVEEELLIMDKLQLAINVNTMHELKVAEEMLTSPAS